MMSRQAKKMMTVVSPFVTLCFVVVQVTCFLPGTASAAASEDLKNIVYKHYFRGNYERAIEELRAFLERDGLAQAETVEAREYLAASLILSGASNEGRDEFLRILQVDGAYKGPDPSVFKAVVVDTYQEVQAEYASMVLRNAPETASTDTGASGNAVGPDKKKPFYKKWWFYASIGAALVVVAAAGSGKDEETPRPTGTVTVDVDLP